MDTRTGEIVDASEVFGMDEAERAHFIPVIRDLSLIEKAQRQITLYEPCGCGSGKKFKFCCFKKP